jgi:hypothetical protein
VREHLLDGFAARAGSEEVVIVGAIRREEIGQRIPIACRCRRRKPLHQFTELHGLLACSRHPGPALAHRRFAASIVTRVPIDGE